MQVRNAHPRGRMRSTLVLLGYLVYWAGTLREVCTSCLPYSTGIQLVSIQELLPTSLDITHLLYDNV